MREESRENAEERLHLAAIRAYEISGLIPALYIQEGDSCEEVLKVIDDNPEIRALVLGAATDGSGPGPLVEKLVGASVGQLHVPLIVVPGSLTDEQITAIT